MIRRAIRVVEQLLASHFPQGSPCRITDEGTGIGVYEIQQRMNGDRYLFPICQLRLTLASSHWHLYWMRKFDAWWPYPPPRAGRRFTLRARLGQLVEDEDGCFWV